MILALKLCLVSDTIAQISSNVTYGEARHMGKRDTLYYPTPSNCYRVMPTHPNQTLTPVLQSLALPLQSVYQLNQLIHSVTSYVAF
jgi:hypothetical protein